MSALSSTSIIEGGCGYLIFCFPMAFILYSYYVMTYWFIFCMFKGFRSSGFFILSLLVVVGFFDGLKLIFFAKFLFGVKPSKFTFV